MRSKIALDLESDEYLDEAVSSGYGLAKPPLADGSCHFLVLLTSVKHQHMGIQVDIICIYI